MNDKQFEQSLLYYLEQFSEGMSPLVPIFRNPDGSIDRKLTLNLPCYEGYK